MLVTKDIYRTKCGILARIVAKSKFTPDKIPTFLAKQTWFMQLNGVQIKKNKVHLSNSGAYHLFGKDWCDKCWSEELIKTETYELCTPTKDPTNPASWYEMRLK